MRKPYPPIFNITLAKTIEPKTGASTWALGSHICRRKQGIFTKKVRRKRAINKELRREWFKEGEVIHSLNSMSLTPLLHARKIKKIKELPLVKRKRKALASIRFLDPPREETIKRRGITDNSKTMKKNQKEFTKKTRKTKRKTRKTRKEVLTPFEKLFWKKATMVGKISTIVKKRRGTLNCKSENRK